MADPEDFRGDFRSWLAVEGERLRSSSGRAGFPVSEEFERQQRLVADLYEAGWSRWGWPEQFGGLGGSVHHRAVFYDELAAADLRVPDSYVMLETLGPTVVSYAPALAEQYLPLVLSGREVWGQGFSEPGAGSDLAAIATTAIASGDIYVVNGQKTWTTLGHHASRACVLVRTGDKSMGRRGLTMLWMDLDSPGITVRPIEAANGIEEFAEMFFDDVRVPRDRLVGDVGEGWSVAMFLLQYERGTYAWLRQAVLHQKLARALAEAPEMHHSAVTTVGAAFIALCELRARSRATVARLAREEVIGPEASVDKILLSRTEHLVADAVRMLAGPGFVADESDAVRAVRSDWFYSRATSIFGGAAEIQRDIVAEHLLGLPRGPRP